MKHAEFVIDEITDDRLVIYDLGPWDQHKTVTNDAEHVVRQLIADGQLTPGRRLFYYDSQGEPGELLVKWPEGTFAGFAPARWK